MSQKELAEATLKESNKRRSLQHHEADWDKVNGDNLKSSTDEEGPAASQQVEMTSM
jgi:hypothetical protein